MARVERRNGNYSTRVSLTDPLTGRRIQPRVTAPTKRELEAAVARLRSEFAAGQWQEPATIPTGLWVERWLAASRAREASTITYEHASRHLLADEIARVPLGRLRRGMVAAFVARLVAAGHAPAYVRTIVACLSMACASAVEREMIASNPVARVKLPATPKRRPPALTIAETRTLLAGVRDDPLEAFWVLAVMLGIRRGELLALAWSDIDLRAGSVRVARTWTRVRRDGVHRWEIGTTTKGGSARTLQLPLVCQAALARHRARGDGTGLVFAGVTPDAATHGWTRLRDRLELPGHVPLHGLRHTAATTMIESGIPVTTVARILGHASATTTLDTYAAVFEDMERRASSVLDGLFEDEPDAAAAR